MTDDPRACVRLAVEQDEPAPDLAPGRSWTYRAKTLYDARDEITIVVAEKNASGYLFAGARREDVLLPLAWGRFTHGPQDRSLNPVSGEARLLDFPLSEGKSWLFAGNLTVTAHRADVRVPGGSGSGWRIEGGGERATVSYGYAASVGYLTDMDWRVRGAPFVRLELARVGVASTYVWGATGPSVEAGPGTFPEELPLAPPADAPAGLAALDVPDGFDGLIASVGATGGDVVVAGPHGESWRASFEAGAERWDTRAFDAPIGRWSVATSSGQDTWSYARLVAVKWITGAPRG